MGDTPKDLNAVYSKFRRTVNMSASGLKRWADNPCSRKASLSRSPITRNLRLLSKSKKEWTARDVRDAKRTISFVSRMRKAPKGDAAAKGCPSKRDISLLNWAFNPKR